MRGAKFPFWGIDDIDFGDFVVSKNISVLDAKEREAELNQFLKKLKTLKSLNDIAEEYIKLFNKLGGAENSRQTKEQYINHMINGNFIAFSRFGYGDEIREFIKNRVEEFSSTKQNTQEQLIKLIKPLIREKLKRKQNGKKNLRN